MPWTGLGPAAIAVALAIALAAAVYVACLVLLGRLTGPAMMQMRVRARRPVLVLSVSVALAVGLPALPLPPSVRLPAQHLVSLCLIGLLAWAMAVVLALVEDVLSRRYDVSLADNLLARKIQTRFGVLRRAAVAVVVVFAVAAMLITFPQVRVLGTSLLASAGIVGVIAGLAAQPILTNLFAGLQIAVTEPIRIDDVVVINGYWGRVEEIDLAYVVVRVWDLRRLVLPLTYLLQQPFENWTYRGSALLGYVYVYADYTVDVDALRTELDRILRHSPEWDGQTANLQMTGADERTVQLRALFGTRNSDERWNLMVRVQELLIRYLRLHAPDQLPRDRLVLETGRARSGPHRV